MNTALITSHGGSTTWVGFLRSHSAITRQLNVDLLNGHGLTLNDYEVLLHLAGAEDGMMRRVDLAASVLLTASGITRLLDGLERAGYVEKAAVRLGRARLVREAHARGATRLARGLQDAPRRDRGAVHEPVLRGRARRSLAGFLSRLPLTGKACTWPGLSGARTRRSTGSRSTRPASCASARGRSARSPASARSGRRRSRRRGARACSTGFAADQLTVIFGEVASSVKPLFGEQPELVRPGGVRHREGARARGAGGAPRPLPQLES